MITLKRTHSGDADFQALVVELDRYLAHIDGDEHAFYAQFNKTDAIKHVVVAYSEGRPVGCGAIKAYADAAMEIKRMYVDPSQRGKGIASLVLNELETWAVSLLCNKCVLETGRDQPDAVALYKKNGYQLIPNYGQYQHVEKSVCFEKTITLAADLTSTDITIRRAVVGDAPLLSELARTTFHDAFSVYPQMPVEELAQYVATEFTVPNMTAQLADDKGFFLLAELAGEVVGYAKLEAISTPSDLGAKTNNPIKLRRLYCKQSALGKGVGASLLQQCLREAQAKKHDGMLLTVWEHNHRAQAFYQKWGFKICGEIAFLFGATSLRDNVMQRELMPV